MFELRPLELSAAGIEEAQRLLERVFPASPVFIRRGYLDWLYLQNPLGQAVGYEARSHGELVAHFATVPVLANVYGRSSRGLLSLNTATHPDHKGKGLVFYLAERTFHAAAEGGYEYVLGVANQNSTPGFLGRLGFTLVSPLDVRIVVSGPRAVESAPAVALERTWDAPLLRWRLANPSGHYRLLGRGRRGHVLARSSVPGLPVILTSRLPGPGWEQLRSAGSLSAPARVWIGLDPRRREIFPFSFPIPMRLRPSPLNLIFKPLRPGLSAPPADSVRFSVLDFDAY